MHEDGGRWVGSNKLVELKNKKRITFIGHFISVIITSAPRSSGIRQIPEVGDPTCVNCVTIAKQKM